MRRDARARKASGEPVRDKREALRCKAADRLRASAHHFATIPLCCRWHKFAPCLLEIHFAESIRANWIAPLPRRRKMACACGPRLFRAASNAAQTRTAPLEKHAWW